MPTTTPTATPTTTPTATAGSTSAGATPSDDKRPENYVFLRGRLAAAPVERQLPSGDLLVGFRLTVARPAADRGHVDSLECVAVRAQPRRSLGRAEPGDVLEVEGRLQRRFWRSPAGPASRYAVDVRVVRLVRAPRVSRAGRRAGA